MLTSFDSILTPGRLTIQKLDTADISAHVSKTALLVKEGIDLN